MAHKQEVKNGKKSKASEFIENQNQCVLCNSQLEIRVESYLEDNLLKEEAICPHCNIKAREANHRMH